MRVMQIEPLHEIIVICKTSILKHRLRICPAHNKKIGNVENFCSKMEVVKCGLPCDNKCKASSISSFAPRRFQLYWHIKRNTPIDCLFSYLVWCFCPEKQCSNKVYCGQFLVKSWRTLAYNLCANLLRLYDLELSNKGSMTHTSQKLHCLIA